MKPTPYLAGITLASQCCRACYLKGLRGGALVSFAVEVLKQEGAQSRSQVPDYRVRLRAAMRRHYRGSHPEWAIR